MFDKELFQLLGNNKYIFITVILMIISMLSNIAITALICYSFYGLINDYAISFYLYLLIAGILLVFIRYILKLSTDHFKDSLGNHVKTELRNKTYHKILKLGTRNISNINMSGLTQISIEGIEQLDLYYSTYLPQLFYSVIAPFILFLISVFIDYRTALILIACVPLIPISIIAVSKYAKRIFSKYWNKYISMGDKFLDSLQGLKDLKIFKADQMQNEKMNSNAEEFRKITMKVLVMQLASTTIMDLIAYGGAALGIVMVTIGLINNYINPIAGLFLILIAVEFFLPLRSLGSAFHVAMNGASAGKKILSLLALPDPKWGNDDVDNFTLTMKNIEFSYGDKKVLNNINLKFTQGLTAIVGESGSGKSTIVNLLLGALIPNNGEILIGDKNIHTLSRANYYSHVASVSSNTYIFNMSIRDNFLIANKNVSDDMIYEALEKVNLSKFIQDNGGLDKVINEDAGNISGGEKQRLALAINLLANKEVYIFDEATSNIDIESEAMIVKNILELSKTKTIIMISHRLENVIHADNIYYLENGEIIESGTHLELLKYNHGYANLYHTQKNLENGYREVLYETK